MRDIFRVCFVVRIGANSVGMGTSEVCYLHIVSTEGKVRDAYRVCFTVCVGTNCVGTSEVSYLHRRGRCEMPTGCVEWCVLEQTWWIFFMSVPSLKGFKLASHQSAA